MSSCCFQLKDHTLSDVQLGEFTLDLVNRNILALRLDRVRVFANWDNASLEQHSSVGIAFETTHKRWLHDQFLLLADIQRLEISYPYERTRQAR